MVGRRLREERNLALDLDETAVGAPRPAGILEHALLDDRGAEPLGGAPQRVGIELVGVVRADYEEPFSPPFPDEILRQPVGQHRAGRRGVDDVGAAVLLAQPVVDRADVEEEKAARAARIGRLEQRVRRQIGDDERDAALRNGRNGGRGIVLVLEPRLLQHEMLVQELAGGVVVVDRQFGAGQAVIGGRHVEQRDRVSALGPAADSRS